MTTTPMIEQPRDVVTRATKAWSRGLQQLVGPLTAADAETTVDGDLVDRFFDAVDQFADRWIDVNRRYVKGVAGAMFTAQGALRERATAMTDVVRDETARAASNVSDQATQAEDLAHEQAAAVERETRREARRRARGAASARFGGMTKVELQDQLARRGLPKSGTVVELRTRLVDAAAEAASN
jgi:hypothetical protein